VIFIMGREGGNKIGQKAAEDIQKVTGAETAGSRGS
jgi:hypothetical protein